MGTTVLDPSSNLLLASLPRRVNRRLAGALESARLKKGQRLIEVGLCPDHVYFPGRRTVILLERPSEESEGLGICAVGREGVVGADAALGDGVACYRAVAPFGGESLRLPTKAFKAAVARHAGFMGQVLRHSQFLLFFATQVALCHRFHRLDRHLASWILNLHELAGPRELPITHDSLAGNLGVRRVGVTQAAGSLQAAGFIRYRWGKLTVLDRRGLIDFACVCYLKVSEARHRFLGASHDGG